MSEELIREARAEIRLLVPCAWKCDWALEATHVNPQLCSTCQRSQALIGRFATALAAAEARGREMEAAIEGFRAMAFLPRGTDPAAILEHYNSVLRSYGYPENKADALTKMLDAAQAAARAEGVEFENGQREIVSRRALRKAVRGE